MSSENRRKPMTIKEMAEHYNISYSSACNLVHAEGCPLIRFGRRGVRIELDAFDKWLKEDYPKIPKIDRRYKRSADSKLYAVRNRTYGRR